MYQEPLNLENSKQVIQFFKLAKPLKNTSPKKYIQMANKHTRCSKSYSMKELQIKMMVEYYTPLRMGYAGGSHEWAEHRGL